MSVREWGSGSQNRSAGILKNDTKLNCLCSFACMGEGERLGGSKKNFFFYVNRHLKCFDMCKKPLEMYKSLNDLFVVLPACSFALPRTKVIIDYSYLCGFALPTPLR